MTNDHARVQQLVEERKIDTVKIGGPDYDGVYRGKRLPADVFLDGMEHGFAQGDVLFGWDIAEQLVPGLRFTNWESGYADLRMLPDLATFRPVPWEEHVATVICDFVTESGEPIGVSPRHVLRRVLERAAEMGYRAELALELEFRIWREDQRSLREKRWRDLTPLSPTTSCYSLHRPTGDEFIVGRLRRMMDAHGVPIEGYNREHGEGMYEMNLRHAPGMEAADRALLFRNGAKELCLLEGLTASFMAKPFAEEDGNSGHLHQSLWNAQGQNVFFDADGEHGISAVFRAYIAGVLRTLPEFFALYAPNVNSYKRYVAGSWAPTVAAWGIETRTPSLRAITGSPAATRLENRVSGSDVNPYLGMAASLAGGLIGIAEGLVAPPPVRGNAYTLPEDVAPRLPRTLDDAIERFDRSALAREWFGDLFVDDFVTMRRWELQQYHAAVSEWERNRYFEMI
ncbi:MAG TPA: glutamine synthetase family protein [Ktedonobacterales bacterium]|nr:glutamine synthetase family protein [Ktedonobacterales bacterium]